MRRIRPLKSAEVQALETGYKTGKKHHFRQRCFGILLSNQNYSVSAISKRLNKKRDTISSWLDRYEEGGINNLQNQSGQGVKAPLDSISKAQRDQLEEIK